MPAMTSSSSSGRMFAAWQPLHRSGIALLSLSEGMKWLWPVVVGVTTLLLRHLEWWAICQCWVWVWVQARCANRLEAQEAQWH